MFSGKFSWHRFRDLGRKSEEKSHNCHCSSKKDKEEASKDKSFMFQAVTKESVESLPKLDSYERIYNWLSHSENEDQNSSYSEESDIASNFNTSEEGYELEIRDKSKSFHPLKIQQAWIKKYHVLRRNSAEDRKKNNYVSYKYHSPTTLV